MVSREYNSLTREVSHLSNKFLGFSPRIQGNYTRSELLDCRAFVSFCHAEIEFYLEEICLKKLNQAENRWVSRGSMGRILASLLAFDGTSRALSEKIKEQQTGYRIESIIRNVIAKHKQAISRNHGIRHKNFSALFTPIGVDPDSLSEVMLTELDELGKRRGSLVHAGSTVSIPRVRDPFSDEKREIDDLVREMLSFDEYLNSLT